MEPVNASTEELLAVRAELESTKEELASTKKELQSTKEELAVLKGENAETNLRRILRPINCTSDDPELHLRNVNLLNDIMDFIGTMTHLKRLTLRGPPASALASATSAGYHILRSLIWGRLTY